jgi:uncharacterized membrane-anchored protein
MNIDPPGTENWLLLLLVGLLAGAVNALRGYAMQSRAERLIVGILEGATALFVTIVTFLILHSVLPAVFGVTLPPLGLIGISGMVAHIGLRQSVRLAMQIVERRQHGG